MESLLSDKLGSHDLPSTLLENLYKITKGIPVLLTTRFFELLDAEILVRGKDNVWRLSEKEDSKKKLAHILEKGGFYAPIETLFDKLEERGQRDLASKFEQFLRVGSVCGKNIPFDAIINFLEISEDTADQLEDLLTDELLDEQGSPILTYLGKTLQDFGQIEIYKFANESMPMVIQEAGAGRPVLGIAQEFYQFLKQHLPIQNRSIARLHLAVVRHAEQSDDEEMLALTSNWWVSQVHVEDFKEELLQQCNNQSLDAETLWNLSTITENIWPPWRRLPLLEVYGKQNQGMPDGRRLTWIERLGKCLYNNGGYKSALNIYREVFREEKKLKREVGATPGYTTNMIGLCLFGHGKYKRSELFLSHTHILFKQHLGPKHPDTLTAMLNLATTLQAQGEYAAAQPLQETVADLFTQHLGPEHPNTLTAMLNLASTLRKLGELKKAQKLEEKVATIREDKHSKEGDTKSH